MSFASLVQAQLKSLHETTQQNIKAKQLKKTIYFSMEFLMGRMITNNLYSLGIYDDVKALFHAHGLDINEVEDFETDAGLGNGGLGQIGCLFFRFCSCIKITIIWKQYSLFKKGFFVQTIEDFKQKRIRRSMVR